MHINSSSTTVKLTKESLPSHHFQLDTMLAMERLPLSQPPYSGHLSLSSPTIHSPRAGLPAPLIQGLPSPPALHSNSHHAAAAAAAAAASHLPPVASSKVRPSSSSSLSSVHTPPPYGDSSILASGGSSVYSPTHTNSLSLLPPSSAEHHDQFGCHHSAAAADHMSMTSLTGMIGHPPSLPIVSSAQESSCSPGGSSVGSSREHHSSSPASKLKLWRNGFWSDYKIKQIIQLVKVEKLLYKKY